VPSRADSAPLDLRHHALPYGSRQRPPLVVHFLQDLLARRPAELVHLDDVPVLVWLDDARDETALGPYRAHLVKHLAAVEMPQLGLRDAYVLQILVDIEPRRRQHAEAAVFVALLHDGA